MTLAVVEMRDEAEGAALVRSLSEAAGLPRCSHPRHRGERVRPHGRRGAGCWCRSATDVDDRCIAVTWQAAALVQRGRRWYVQGREEELRAAGLKPVALARGESGDEDEVVVDVMRDAVRPLREAREAREAEERAALATQRAEERAAFKVRVQAWREQREREEQELRDRARAAASEAALRETEPAPAPERGARR